MDTVFKKGFSVQNYLEKDNFLTSPVVCKQNCCISCPTFGALMDHHSMCCFADLITLLCDLATTIPVYFKPEHGWSSFIEYEAGVVYT
jgi:hypothetical protein